MLNSERDRTFNGGLAGHTGILFKVVHAYAFEHADRQDLFQEIVIQIWRSVDAFRGESSVPVDVPRRAEHGNRVDAQGGRRQAAARGCGRPVDKVSGWDYAVAVAGLAATLALWRTIYVGYREQARREQAFGDSLRDQVNRQIAMIDPFMINPWATRASRKKVAPYFMLSLVLIAAIGFMSARLNGNEPYDEAWRSAVGTILIGLFGGWVAGLWLRRWNRRIGAPRKRRLEALLKEFDN